jgi:hypothetical protein
VLGAQSSNGFVSRAIVVDACDESHCVAMPPDSAEIVGGGVIKRVEDGKALICMGCEGVWSSSRMLHIPAITDWRGFL